VDDNRRMFRKLGALVGIVVVVGLALALMWHVYLHHQRAGQREEPPVVILAVPSEIPVKTASHLS
jgi:hypothetical protein